MTTTNSRSFASGGSLLQGSFTNRTRKPAEIMLVPMIDIFTVLVTFLLMTAVFSRVTILQLDLPSANDGSAPAPPEFRLEVIVRESGFELTNGDTLIAALPKLDGEYDFAALNQLAAQLKREYPDVDDASILMERQIEYDYLIQVMDAIRSAPATRALGNRRPVQSHRRGRSAMSLLNRAPRQPEDAQLNLIPLIDVMSVMVAFLLIYTADVEIVQNTKGVEIPQSSAQTQAQPSVVVTITKDHVFVQGELVADVAEVSAADTPLVEPLRRVLDRPMVLGEATPSAATVREVTVIADKSLPFELVKKVMATCTATTYGKISLAVLQK
jgi:biopolymer transport protein TolR